MEPQEIGGVDRGQTVPIRAHEGFVADQVREALEAPTRHRVRPGVDQVDFPIALLPHPHVDFAGSEVNRQVVVCGVQRAKVILDYLLTIAARDDELFEAGVGIELHQVYENGLSADLDHGLRTDRRLLRKAGTEAACEQHDFHKRQPPFLAALAPVLGCCEQVFRSGRER
jgi:hypothetical protein